MEETVLEKFNRGLRSFGLRQDLYHAAYQFLLLHRVMSKPSQIQCMVYEGFSGTGKTFPAKVFRKVWRTLSNQPVIWLKLQVTPATDVAALFKGRNSQFIIDWDPDFSVPKHVFDEEARKRINEESGKSGLGGADAMQTRRDIELRTFTRMLVGMGFLPAAFFLSRLKGVNVVAMLDEMDKRGGEFQDGLPTDIECAMYEIIDEGKVYHADYGMLEADPGDIVFFMGMTDLRRFSRDKRRRVLYCRTAFPSRDDTVAILSGERSEDENFELRLDDLQLDTIQHLSRPVAEFMADKVLKPLQDALEEFDRRGLRMQFPLYLVPPLNVGLLVAIDAIRLVRAGNPELVAEYLTSYLVSHPSELPALAELLKPNSTMIAADGSVNKPTHDHRAAQQRLDSLGKALVHEIVKHCLSDEERAKLQSKWIPR